MKKRKILIMGFDGANLDLIIRGVKRNVLPNFKKIVKKGVYGNLKSTIPPMTSPAWPSFYTGKNPGKIGVYNFGGFDQGFDIEAGQASVVNSRKILSDKIWNILSDEGKKCVIINMPVTYPPEKINGYMISDFLTPSTKHEFTYPKGLKKKIIETVGDYVIHIEDIKGNVECGESKITSQTIQIMDYFIKNDWDFLLVWFGAPDWYLHKSSCKEECEKRTLNFFKRIDLYLEKLLHRKDINFIFMSDHGSTYRKSKWLHINRWLEEEMLLKRKSDINLLGKLPIDKMKVYNFFLRLGIDIQNILPKGIQSKIKNPIYDIDLNNTVACSTDYFNSRYGGIRINLKDEDENVVKSGEEYENLRSTIINKLKQLKNSDGEKVIEEIHKREELYRGGYTHMLPDILFRTVSKYTPVRILSHHTFGIHYPRKLGDHAMNGMLMVYGPDIKVGGKIREAQIIDLAPTILHMFGLPVPDDMDGSVLKWIFKPRSEPTKRKVAYCSAEKTRIIKRVEKLKKLGKI